MSDQATITSETALMMEKMVGLTPDDPRYMVLKAALDYKASWIDLAEHLNVVAENKDYKEWGYKAFKDYCSEELQIRQATARKLVRGFQWIDQEAPELLPRLIDDQVDVAARDSGVMLPDVDTVDVLVKAQKEVKKERLSRDVYDDLKELISYCSVCSNITDRDPCFYCTDHSRDRRIICVVETPHNVAAVERTRDFKGAYHVLMGALSPLKGVGPDDLHIKGLLERVGADLD